MYSDEQIAQVVHEANRALQDIGGDEAPSQPWACETAETRASAAEGVRKARAGRTPEQLHRDWAEWKTARGWTYGPDRDPDARTHPCLLPYEDLPEHQRVKDRVFLAIVRELAPAPAEPAVCPKCGTAGCLEDANSGWYDDAGGQP